jgi:hypothetical protein
MRVLPFVQALKASPAQREQLAAAGAALVALAVSLAAPIAGLLVLAGLVAAALMSNRPRPSWRPDRLAWGGLIVAAAAGVAAGAPGFVGGLFCWFLADSARAAVRRSAIYAGAAPPRLSERLPLILVAVFVGLLVAAAAPHVVMGLPLDLPHPPLALIIAAGVAYALTAVDWLVRILARWRLGESRPSQVAADAAFHAVVLAGFVVSNDVSAGVVALTAYRLTLAVSLRREVLAAV